MTPSHESSARDQRQSDDVHVSWHENDDGTQVVLGIDTDRVKLSVAFPPEADPSAVRAALRARDRALLGYFEDGPSRPEEAGADDTDRRT